VTTEARPYVRELTRHSRLQLLGNLLALTGRSRSIGTTCDCPSRMSHPPHPDLLECIVPPRSHDSSGLETRAMPPSRRISMRKATCRCRA